jgi:hypothetical protein
MRQQCFSRQPANQTIDPNRLDSTKEKAMKTIKNLFAEVALFSALLLAAPAVRAQITDGYTSLQDMSTTTNFNQVVFPGAVTKAITLSAFDLNADTNIADLHLFAGTTPYAVTGIINGTNLVVASNAGVVTNQLCILQFGLTNWIATVLSTNNLTNIFLAGGATLGFTTPTNATLWNCTNRFVQRVPTGRTAFAGDSIFAAQVRAPTAVRLTPSLQSGTNKLHVTAYYRPSP